MILTSPGTKLSSFFHIKREKKENGTYSREVLLPQVKHNRNGEICGVISFDGKIVSDDAMAGYLCKLVIWGYENFRPGYFFSPKSKEWPEKVVPRRRLDLEYCRSQSAEWWNLVNQPSCLANYFLFSGERFQLPTLCTDKTGFYSYGGVTAIDACFLWAVVQGISMHDYDNPIEAISISNTASRKAVLEERLAPVFAGILSDSLWNVNQLTSFPSSGIVDFERYILFSHDIRPQDLEDLKEWLYLTGPESIMGVSFSREGNLFTFRATKDSSG